MSSPTYVTEPTVVYLQQILDDLARGHMQVPRFQRAFVWSDDQRLELLQSIRDGIPIGSILVWRTARLDLKSVRSIGPHELPEPVSSPTAARTYILDGLQRLSTLFGCLRPLPDDASPYKVQEDRSEISWRVGYDLETQEFQILGREDTQRPTWLPLNVILDSIKLLTFQRGLAERPDFKELVRRSDALAEAFRTYKLPVVPIVTDDLAGATRTFERVNRQGTAMTELQMVRALTWRTDFDVEEALAAVRETLPLGWDKLDLDVILRCCKAAGNLDIAKATPEDLAKQLREGPEVIEEVGEALHRTAEWLRSQCHIHSPIMVPYRLHTVLLTEAFRKNPRLVEKGYSGELYRWLWLTTYGGAFAGLASGAAGKFVADIRGIAAGSASTYDTSRVRADSNIPVRFVTRNVRVLSSALRLAELGPLDLDGKPIDAYGQLGQSGPAALVPIIQVRGPDVPAGITNRMFCGASDDLRRAVFAGTGPQKILDSHAIDAVAAEALWHGDWATFGMRRSEAILEIEASFVSDLLNKSHQ